MKNARIALCDHCKGFFCRTLGYQFNHLSKDQMEAQKRIMLGKGFNVRVCDEVLAGRWCPDCDECYSGPETQFGQAPPPSRRRKSLLTIDADPDAFGLADQD